MVRVPISCLADPVTENRNLHGIGGTGHGVLQRSQCTGQAIHAMVRPQRALLRVRR